MKSIDINCDMGEQNDLNSDIKDHQLMPFISSANISCGAHSGSKEVIESTVRYAQEHDIRIGAHPSYPDKANFGRVSIDMPPDKLFDTISFQLDFLNKIVQSCNTNFLYVKPHGALYNDMIFDERKSDICIKAIRRFNPDLKVMGMAESPVKKWVEDQDMVFISEAFADRKYAGKNTLVSRSVPYAVLESPDEVRKQLSGFLQNSVTDEHGITHFIEPESICFHSDTPGALNLLKESNQFLKLKDVQIGTD